MDSAEAELRALWGPATLTPRDAPVQQEGPIAVEGATLLAVTPDPELRAAIDRIASVNLLDVIFAEDAAHALASAFLRRPDGVLVELDTAGLDVARGLHGLLGTNLPCSVIARAGTLEERMAAAEVGATLFLTRPIEPEVLTLALRQMVVSATSGSFQAVVIGDDPAALEKHRIALERRGLSVVTTGVAACMEAIGNGVPDVFVLLASTSGRATRDLCRAIRTSAEWQDVPILVAGGPPGERLAALTAGADDFLANGWSADAVAVCATTKAERARRLRERMDTDLLTGLMRRRGFLEALMRSQAECGRNGRPMAVVLCDVDHFKGINDRHGHASGDLVLAAFGRLLAGSFRAQDLRGRWGGEEFILAFPGETSESVRRAVESVLDHLAAIPFVLGGAPPFHVTCSAGVASAPRDGTSVEELLRAADRRLYAAKRSGRARVVGTD